MANKKTITADLFRKFLRYEGLEHVRTKGSHEQWFKNGLTRSVIFSNNLKEIPVGVLRSNLRTLNMNMKRFLEIIDGL